MKKSSYEKRIAKAQKLYDKNVAEAKMKKTQLANINHTLREGYNSVDEVISNLDGIKKQILDGLQLHNKVFDSNIRISFPGGYYDEHSLNIALQMEIPKTEEDLAIDKKNEQEREARDRVYYEQLKKRFEKTNTKEK